MKHALFAIAAFLLSQQFLFAKDNILHNSALPVVSYRNDITEPKVIRFKGDISNNKIVLEWEVSENETAYKFEVEKSIDGKNFKMAALVFGTDKADKDIYQFYEKATAGSILYRIKIVEQDNKAAYSEILTITNSSN